MPHRVQYNQEKHLFEMTFSGPIDLQEIRQLVRELARKIAEKDCLRFLTDYREATVLLSTVEI